MHGPLTRAAKPKGSIMKLASIVRAFATDTRGVTAVEYGIIAAGVAVAIIGVVNGLGTKLTTTFQSVSDAIK